MTPSSSKPARYLATFLFFVLSFQSISGLSSSTVYTKVEIPTYCQRYYDHGGLFVRRVVEKGGDISNKGWFNGLYDNLLSQVKNSECKFFYSMGVFDNLKLMQ